MNPRATLRAGLWAVSAFAAAYLLCNGLQLPVPHYDPVGRAFSLGAPEGAIGMRYYGDVLVAALAAAAAFAAGARLPLTRPLDVATATGAALALVALDAAFFLSRVLAAR